MITQQPEQWDRTVDVVVLGSGCAGLTAATLAHDGGAEVLVLEKADLIGGTTGVSGGMPWVPMNRHMADLGIDDDREEALGYIRRLTLGREPDPALLETYVDTAPEMIDYLEAKTPLRMYAPSTFNDYYEGMPGGRSAGRSIEPVPFDAGSELGDWAPRLRTSPHLARLTMEEGAKFLRGDGPPDYSLIVDRERDDVRVGGPALVAMLFKGLLDRGVAVETGTAARELVVVDGEVRGVRVETADGSVLVGARRGVVIACGGFEWNKELVATFIGQELYPLSPPNNVGDGLMMAMEAGAALANMTSFWGQPALLDPDVEFEGQPLYQMGTLRSFPGVIAVNGSGRRFCNEGVTYQDFPKALATFDPVTVDYPNAGPLWLVFDQRVRDRAVILPSLMPGQPTPPWMESADDLAALAAAIGVDGDVLTSTVERWNDQVANGDDVDFHRGTMRFETHMSGSFPSPATAMAPVARPPFYAIRLYNGALGTSGGPNIDEHGRVRRLRGGVLPGLYAAGNAAASVFGPAYPGGGATIGPAMTFGYLAGKHAAARHAAG
jgi:succinate dehydrogenase/fumarate reductase flavoprotein subunit